MSGYLPKSVRFYSSILKQSRSVEKHQFQGQQLVREAFSGADIEINGARNKPWDIHVKNPSFFQRILRYGSLGLGESYMDGWWECRRLDMFHERFLKNRVGEHLSRITCGTNDGSDLRSEESIWMDMIGEKHYHLGHDIYSRMLDPYMQYSCAYWNEAVSLEEAQENKLRMICEKLHLQPGMRILDIGCGWGGLAEYAARNYNVNVTGVTISGGMQEMAEKRCRGLDVQILYLDYHDLNDEQFDRIVAVEMFEFIGPKNHGNFFRVAERCLKENGLFLLQTSGLNESVETVDEWTAKYIFPNYYLPSIKQIAEATEPHFIIEDLHNFGVDYDKTQMIWCERFLEAWPDIARAHKDYDERFKRMFEYFLGAWAAAARTRKVQLWQIVFSKKFEARLQFPR